MRKKKINNFKMEKTYFKLFTIVLFLIVHYTLTIDNCEAQWQPDVRLTNDQAESWTGYSNSWSVASNGSMVHTVWRDNRDGDWEIYYKRSSNGGLNWNTDVRLTNSVGNADFQSITISGMYVHVVWEDSRDGNREIYYKRSTDRGLSWGADIRLTNDTNVSTHPSISVSGSFVHIVWCDNRDELNTEIYYKRSTDNGTSWGTDTRMTNELLASFFPSVSASGSNVHIVWEDNRDGNYEIFYKRSTNGGLSWGADTRLTNNTAISEFPSLYALGLNVNVVWVDKRDGNDEIYSKRSSDGGINWGSDTRLTNNPAEKSYPNITGSGQNVHVVWEDMRDLRNQVYYKRSTDFGASWGNDIPLSLYSGNQLGPSVGVSGTSVHVVWMDNRAGNYEIFYKRNPTGNISPTYTVSGRVTFKDNGQPVNQGFVKALHYDSITHNVIRVDSTIILPGGYYTLPKVPQDSTDIMYYQNDEDGLQFVPTYYISTIDWQEANTIYPTQNLTNIDGQVYRINNDSSSNLYIRGICYSQNYQPVNTLEDVIIYAKIGNDFKNYGISNGNGVYFATKLPNGSYTLLAYRMGYECLALNITISNNNLDTINFYFTSPIGIKQLNETVPLKINLYQNYPNPFNPVTKITFDIPDLSGLLGVGKNNILTELKIYDVLGKEAEILVYKQLQPGTYEVIWNAIDHPTGLYFCMLKIGEFLQTKKMILIK